MNKIAEELKKANEDLVKIEQKIREKYSETSDKNRMRVLSGIQKSASSLKGLESQIEYLKTSAEMEVVTYIEEIDDSGLHTAKSHQNYTISDVNKYVKRHKQIVKSLDKMQRLTEELLKGTTDWFMDLKDYDELAQ